jgi:hypothetical protein
VSVNGLKLNPNIEQVIYTGDALPLAYWMDALVAGSYWDRPGSAQTVTYGFYSSNPLDIPFQAFSAADQESTRVAFATWAEHTQLNFQLVPVEQADIRLGFFQIDAGGDATERKRAVSSAKVKIADAARQVSQESVQLHGGMGMTEELKVSHNFRRLTMIAQRFGDADHHLERYAALS